MGFFTKLIPSKLYLGLIAVVIVIGVIAYINNNIESKHRAYEKTIFDVNASLNDEKLVNERLIAKNNNLELSNALEKSENEKLVTVIETRNKDIEILSDSLTKSKNKFKEWVANNDSNKWGKEGGVIIEQNLTDPTCDELKTLNKSISGLNYENL
jgi:hypothetical protein